MPATLDDLNKDPGNHHKLIDLIETNKNYLCVDGQYIVQNEDGEFPDHVVMDEVEFVTNWLTGFARGYVGNKCYFNLAGWAELTSDFVKGVIVLRGDKKDPFVIPKFTDYTPRTDGERYTATLAAKANGIKNIIDPAERERAAATFASTYKQIAEREPTPEFYEYVPIEIFYEYKVYPWVEKSILYILDNFSYHENGEEKDIRSNENMINRIREVLTKLHLTGNISKEDLEFINTTTNNCFDVSKAIILDTSNTQIPIAKVTEESVSASTEEYDPFSE